MQRRTQFPMQFKFKKAYYRNYYNLHYKYTMQWYLQTKQSEYTRQIIMLISFFGFLDYEGISHLILNLNI